MLFLYKYTDIKILAINNFEYDVVVTVYLKTFLIIRAA